MTSLVRDAYDANAELYATLFLDELGRDTQSTKWLSTFAAEAARRSGPVVDLGCGPGSVVNHLSGLGLTASGIDLSPGQVEQAREAFPDLQVEANECGRFSGSTSALDDQSPIPKQREPVVLDPGDFIQETVLIDGVFGLVGRHGRVQPSTLHDLGGWLLDDEADQSGLWVLVGGAQGGQVGAPSAVFLATLQDEGLSVENARDRVWLVHDALMLPTMSDTQMLLSGHECSTLDDDALLVVLAEVSPFVAEPVRAWRIDLVTLTFTAFDSDKVECEYESA